MTNVVLPKLHNSWPRDHEYYNYGIVFKIKQSVYPLVCVSTDHNFLILNAFYYMAILVLWFHDVPAQGPKPMTKGQWIFLYFIDRDHSHAFRLSPPWIYLICESRKKFIRWSAFSLYGHISPAQGTKDHNLYNFG